jgi:AraC-like DNA-binding protein
MSQKTKNITKEFLEELHIGQKKSLSKIAAELGISYNYLHKLFGKFGVQKVKNQKVLISKKVLEDLYLTKRLRLSDICTQLGISTSSLYQLFNRYEIPKRPNSAKAKTTIDLNSPEAIEALKHFYYEEKLGYVEIGKRFAVSASRVYIWLRDLGMLDRGPIPRKIKENINKADLTRLFVLERKSLMSISNTYNTSTRKLKKLLEYYNISRTPNVPRDAFLSLDKDLLQKLYIEENRTATEVAKILGVSLYVIRHALQHHGISIKPVPSKNKGLNVEEIRKQYLEEQATISGLAAKYEMSFATMARFLKKHNMCKRGIQKVVVANSDEEQITNSDTNIDTNLASN